jgi:DNA-binding CsgD family transcriptional regulator
LSRLSLVRAARAEAAWLAGDPERVRVEAQSLFELTVRHGHNRLSSELAFWLWRIGELASPPPNTLEPFALQMSGNWEEAAACWRALGCPYEAAWALADSGDESALRDALAEFTRLGAAPATAMMSQRLRELGARGIPRGPRPATCANPAHLTRRQAEILELVAEGRCTAEIAARLYLSPRTVAHHISAILAKLGVHSRAEAVQEAARRGIVAQNRPSAGPN